MQKDLKNRLFKNREDVATFFLDILPVKEMKRDNWIIIALSSGGFVIAKELAKRLNLTIDFLFNETITAPLNADCEVARVSETEEIVIHEILTQSFGIQNDYIFGKAKHKYEDHILPKIYSYRKDSTFCTLKKKHVLFIDQGCETGLKMMLGIKSALKQEASSIYVASPVMPYNIACALRELTDDVFSIYEVKDYLLTSDYYTNFEDISNEKLHKIFNEIRIKKKEKDG